MKPYLTVKNWSLRVRIFLAMIVVTLIASVLIASVSLVYFNLKNQEYHQDKLLQKENQIKEHIQYILATTPHPLATFNIQSIFRKKIFEIANIHNLEIDIYDLGGRLLISSKAPLIRGQIAFNIPDNIVQNLKHSVKKRYVDVAESKNSTYRFSYTYLMDYVENKPIGIVRLPYKEDGAFYKNEIHGFLAIFGYVYLAMIVVSVFIAFYLSRYITKSLQTISDRLTETSLTQKNEKIELTTNSYEIDSLISSYNNMIDQLEESACKLAQSQREEAWREMAKQVAHEIKNPLTPMRLTVQSYQRKFDPKDPQATQKLDEYSKTLIQQIDTMSAVASAFSNFASMPAQQNETLNIVDVVDLTLDIFNEDYILFVTQTNEIITKIDKTQLIRIVTNLVKNAIQSIPEQKQNKKIIVTVKKQQNNAVIEVKDNGKGIEEIYANRIFEPKFTTKTSGMGLGLAIIKNIIENYNGNITFESKPGIGTTFTVTLPIINK